MQILNCLQCVHGQIDLNGHKWQWTHRIQHSIPSKFASLACPQKCAQLGRRYLEKKARKLWKMQTNGEGFCIFKQLIGQLLGRRNNDHVRLVGIHGTLTLGHNLLQFIHYWQKESRSFSASSLRMAHQVSLKKEHLNGKAWTTYCVSWQWSGWPPSGLSLASRTFSAHCCSPRTARNCVCRHPIFCTFNHFQNY